MPSVIDVAADLAAEQGALDAVVAPLDAESWSLPTPSQGWTVADQIGHLCYFDRTAALALTDTAAFTTHRESFFAAAGAGLHAADDLTLTATRAMTPDELLDHWREGRSALQHAAQALTDTTRVEWYGPPMSSRSFLTARLMEAWAHGQDVCDAVGTTRTPTDRLRHIAQLGVITRAWSYLSRGLDMPDGDVRVELTGPGGDGWEWEPASSPDRIDGPAVDFCLVVTQRRHVDDTDLVTNGPLAREWLEIAQAFAGPSTDGPAPGDLSRC